MLFIIFIKKKYIEKKNNMINKHDEEIKKVKLVFMVMICYLMLLIILKLILLMPII